MLITFTIDQDNINSISFAKLNGLIPAVIQDELTKSVLMVGFMNKEAVLRTLQTRKVHYFSRSKNRIWMKGESSEHIQSVKKIFLDCDFDSLLLIIEQNGVCCHTLQDTCFFREVKL